MIIFLAALLLIGIDVFTEFQGGRDPVVLLFVLGVSVLMDVLALIGFIYLADQWHNTSTAGPSHAQPGGDAIVMRAGYETQWVNGARSAVAFYFISFVLWVRRDGLHVDPSHPPRRAPWSWPGRRAMQVCAALLMCCLTRAGRTGGDAPLQPAT